MDIFAWFAAADFEYCTLNDYIQVSYPKTGFFKQGRSQKNKLWLLLDSFVSF